MFFVRTATQQDVLAIRDVLATTWRDTYARFYGTEKVEEIIADWHSVASIKARIAKTNSEYLVADDGTQIGGVAFASLTGKIINLHQLYIMPHLQRQGIGQMLFAEIENCFMDADKIALEVEPKNESAIAFYEAHGFTRNEIIANCGAANSGIPARKMTKTLIA
jgi:ribosomal protein S18 acetylase RimI-like enzyme